jgi:hypothetical protein
MNTKLTLTIEQEIIKRAKKYAQKNGRSLSGLIENYLKAVTTEEKTVQKEKSPLTDSLKGSFKAPADFDYKKSLEKQLSKKYLFDEKNPH